MSERCPHCGETKNIKLLVATCCGECSCVESQKTWSCSGCGKSFYSISTGSFVIEENIVSDK